MSAQPPDEFTNLWTQHRAYVVDLAFRMLGNIHDAEDVVQEAFGRLLARDLDTINDPRGWLVVVVSRLCLDQLRSARVRHTSTASNASEALDAMPAPPALDPADRVTLDDSISLALLVVLQQLTPAERAVFVLHDLFQFSFEATSEIVGRTPAACRQLASRARRHIESETGPSRFTTDTVDHDLIARRFIAACAGGDLAALLELLDVDVVGDVDLGAAGPARRPLRGHQIVGRNLLNFYGPDSNTTLVSQPVNGQPGILAFRDRELVGILVLQDVRERIHDIHAIADPAKLAFIDNKLQRALS